MISADRVRDHGLCVAFPSLINTEISFQVSVPVHSKTYCKAYNRSHVQTPDDFEFSCFHVVSKFQVYLLKRAFIAENLFNNSSSTTFGYLSAFLTKNAARKMHLPIKFRPGFSAKNPPLRCSKSFEAACLAWVSDFLSFFLFSLPLYMWAWPKLRRLIQACNISRPQTQPASCIDRQSGRCLLITSH